MPTIPWPDFDFVTLVLLFFLTWLVSKILRVGRRESYLPPGPPTIPILGNLHLFPTASPYIKFAEWGQQYGDIYSLKISSGNAVVVNSMEVAAELLDKRGATTADRPKLHMVDKVTGGLNLALCRYSDTWRVLRKAAHTILTPKAVEKHLPIQVAEATQILHDFLTNPDNFFEHIGRYSNSVVIIFRNNGAMEPMHIADGGASCRFTTVS
uniref:Cytochrome p450 n=1 Tax=Moniliophthora roreri TaxID=221103 RepID=A0A0W0G8B7_MONRR